MDDKDKASVWGSRAAVYMEYGYDGNTKSLDYIERAIKLDENEAEWHFLLGKALGRLRRINRSRDVPQEKEINALQKAFDLTGYVPYMLFLAQVYRETASTLYRCHKDDFQMFKAKCENMNDRAYTLYKNALALRKDCSHVNLRCAQGILKMPREYRNMELVSSCIKTALHLGPTNPMAHHVAGHYYWEKKDLEKARQHYRKAAESGVYGAYMDLIRLDNRTVPNYDPVPEFSRMLERFKKEKPLLLKTYVLIGSYWYFVKNDFKEAFKYWKKPLSESPTSDSVTAHTSLFLRMHTPVDIRDIVFNEAQLQLKTESISPEDSELMLDLVQEYSKGRPLNSSKSLRKKVLDEIAEAGTKFSSSRGRGQAGRGRGSNMQRGYNRGRR
ncbi:uncharacterized protein [Anabrus simplex]|uniref:uncharacterized protein n=1 Tax=Anabrus simplex TaxID=316456 RepID=UPI0035A32B20